MFINDLIKRYTTSVTDSYDEFCKTFGENTTLREACFDHHKKVLGAGKDLATNVAVRITLLGIAVIGTAYIAYKCISSKKSDGSTRNVTLQSPNSSQKMTGIAKSSMRLPMLF